MTNYYRTMRCSIEHKDIIAGIWWFLVLHQGEGSIYFLR